MKDILKNLLEALRRTNGPTRWVIGAAMALVLGVCGISVYKSSNPHMELLLSALDSTQFSSATSALSNAGVRFDHTLPPGPYSIFVPSGERFIALNAIHGTGALDTGEKGINTNSGASEVFLGTAALAQLTHKRDWEDLEKQLEVFTWVFCASVRSSPRAGSTFQRLAPPTVSVIITLRSAIMPSRDQRQALASIVRGGTNVPEENISIADQNGNILFEGNRDAALEASREFEASYTERETQHAQDYLDELFGSGMTVVHVRGEWNHDRIESVNEAFNGTKVTLVENTYETTTPLERMVGGPAGVESVLGGGGTGNSTSTADTPSATTSDQEKRYAYPRKTTHTVQTAPVLERISVSLTIDLSLEAELEKAADLVKGLVGFVDTRDHMTAVAMALQGIERDTEGNPIAAVAEPVPEPPNPVIGMLLERGVEILAAAVFLFVLLRSLKKAKLSADPSESDGDDATNPGDDEDLDLGLLARRRVDQLIEDEPEKVGVLLSRWASNELQTGGVPR